MKYIFVLIVITVYIIHPDIHVWGFSNCPLPKGTSEAEGLGGLSHFTYLFLHANIIHLIINAFSLIATWIVMQCFFRKWYFFLVPFALAVATSFIPLCIFDKPTVGVSGVIYAMVGMILPYFQFKKSYLFYLTITISLLVSFFLQNSNFWLHLFCLSGGVVFTIIYKLIIRAFH